MNRRYPCKVKLNRSIPNGIGHGFSGGATFQYQFLPNIRRCLPYRRTTGRISRRVLITIWEIKKPLRKICREGAEPLFFLVKSSPVGLGWLKKKKTLRHIVTRATRENRRARKENILLETLDNRENKTIFHSKVSLILFDFFRFFLSPFIMPVIGNIVRLYNDTGVVCPRAGSAGRFRTIASHAVGIAAIIVTSSAYVRRLKPKKYPGDKWKTARNSRTECAIRIARNVGRGSRSRISRVKFVYFYRQNDYGYGITSGPDNKSTCCNNCVTLTVYEVRQ